MDKTPLYERPPRPSNITPGVYRHYKGALYRVLFLAQDSTNPPGGESTEAPVVIYVALDEPHKGNVCARLASQFSEPVEWPDGVQRARFARVDA